MLQYVGVSWIWEIKPLLLLFITCEMFFAWGSAVTGDTRWSWGGFQRRSRVRVASVKRSEMGWKGEKRRPVSHSSKKEKERKRGHSHVMIVRREGGSYS